MVVTTVMGMVLKRVVLRRVMQNWKPGWSKNGGQDIARMAVRMVQK